MNSAGHIVFPNFAQWQNAKGSLNIFLRHTFDTEIGIWRQSLSQLPFRLLDRRKKIAQVVCFDFALLVNKY